MEHKYRGIDNKQDKCMGSSLPLQNATQTLPDESL